ncbi:hypothetical protein [Crystallibacter degradans]|uniref:hypothetical protein n=1 Tax=Crystallibacter degradans TaxID=2726743 RepID=UPI0014747F65|nr:hypothetical protein [Arthrobacter sp. SF27]NMR28980.1 hypothetical protein [Arthrobacter sp. SF27]
MNETPRALNRVLLTLIGLLLAAVGATAVALAAAPALAGTWHAVTRRAGAGVENVLAATTLPGQRDSWLWIVLALVMLVLIVLMIAWVAQQGKGRASTLAADYNDDGGPGTVELGAAVAEQALKAALLEHEEILHATVATYEFRGTPGLRIRVLPRKGVPPYLVAEQVSDLVEALDLVIGRETPVVISIGTSARARLGRTERVH